MSTALPSPPDHGDAHSTQCATARPTAWTAAVDGAELTDAENVHAGAEFDVDRERYPRAAVMADVKELSHISNLHTACTILLQWLIVAVAAWAAVASEHWAIYIIAGLIICSRQQAMGVLVHDATHFHLFTNRAVNDVVSDLFLAFPLGISTTLYRDFHYKHHRYTASERDPDWAWMMHEPDWQWPKTRWGCFWLFVRSLFALNLLQTAKVYLMYSPSAKLFTPITAAYPLRARVLYVASSIAVFSALYVTNAWIPAILLWAVPSMTFLNVLSRVRATAEHVLLPNTHQLNSTRTVIPNWLERVFVAPFGINYHIEHHLFPSVPGLNLRKLHDLLMRDENFRARAHITHGYFNLRRGLLAELLAESTASGGSAGRPPPAQSVTPRLQRQAAQQSAAGIAQYSLMCGPSFAVCRPISCHGGY